MLVQPLSAAAERVFFNFIKLISSFQESSLEDYIHLSVMLQYNNYFFKLELSTGDERVRRCTIRIVGKTNRIMTTIK